jgi:hypothetical protein
VKQKNIEPETMPGCDGEGQEQFTRQQLSDYKFTDTVLFYGVSEIL